MQVASPVATTVSAAWDRAEPAASVVIATHDRAAFLPELFAALAGQVDAPSFELVIADDGSTDTTWQVLESLVAETSMPVKALRLTGCGGPSVPRNTAVQAARGALLAFTDDDCLPTPGWLAAITPAADAGRIVQGATRPTRSGQASPWDRSITIAAESGLWESCNLALPRQLFEAVGGFPVLDLLPAAGRGFGEDAVLGAAAERLAGGYWAPRALVDHRWLPGTFRTHLDGMRRLTGMPALIRLMPQSRDRAFARYFRSRRSAAFDAAVVGAAVAVASRRGVPLLAALPWLRIVTRSARTRWGRPLPVRMAQEATADLVGAAALAKGSAKARTLLL